VIERRLRDAAEEIRRYSDYHYVLINRELAESDAILSSIVRAERVRRTRIEEQIGPYWNHFRLKRGIDIMADIAPKNNAHCTIPDDEEQSTYRFIIVAAKRAAATAGRRAAGAAHVFEKVHHHRDGRSAPRVGEILR